MSVQRAIQAAPSEVIEGPSALDDDSFDEWYTATWPRVVRVALANVRTVHEAEDIAADACTALLRRWDDDRPANPTAWVLTVAVHRARKLAPRLRRTFGASGAAEAIDLDVDLDLLDAIRHLPPRQRTAIALRYLADLTQAEVADSMGIASGTAAALLNQARANLRHRLEER